LAKRTPNQAGHQAAIDLDRRDRPLDHLGLRRRAERQGENGGGPDGSPLRELDDLHGSLPVATTFLRVALIFPCAPAASCRY
jgi:hypothetical protein